MGVAGSASGMETPQKWKQQQSHLVPFLKLVSAVALGAPT